MNQYLLRSLLGDPSLGDVQTQQTGSQHAARSAKPQGFIECTAGIDDIGDDHRIKRNCEAVVARNDLLSDKGQLIGAGIDDCDDRHAAIDGRQDGDLSQVRLSTQHKVLEVQLSRRLKDARAVRLCLRKNENESERYWTVSRDFSANP